MSLTGIKTRPQLTGTLASLGPWASLFARSGFRVYPFQLGAMVRSSSTGTTVLTDGLGDFRQNDYIVVCTPTAYGDSTLFQPVLSKITRITSDPNSAVDDTLTISPAVVVSDGDYLLNLGADGAAAPLTAPNYDGSLLTLYTDPVGNTANTHDYLLTGENGRFFGWLESSIITTGNNIQVVDLLITNSSGVPQLVLPLFAVGPHLGPFDGNTVLVPTITGNDNMQTTINAAIAAVAAAGGGIVQLGPGTFRISSAIFIKSNVWLRGSGWATTIQLAAQFIDDIPPVGNRKDLYGMISAGDRGSEYTPTNPIVGARVSDMAFDYNSLWCYGAIKMGKTQDFLAENLLLDAHSHVEAGNPLKFGIEVDATSTLIDADSIGPGRIIIRGCTFKGFADFNTNVISLGGSTVDSHGLLVEGNIFDTCVGFCVATPNGQHQTIVISGNSFYACSYPVNLEGTNPNYVRNCLISGNVMTGLPLVASPSGFNSEGKIAIWMFLGSPGVDSSSVHYAINITNNVIKGYQEIVQGTCGHMRFANNFCYDWGMGPSGGSGIFLGQAAGGLEIIGHIAIEDNYFYQTTPRIASGIHATINIDTSVNLPPVSFASPTGHDVTRSTGSWLTEGWRVGDTVRFTKTGGLNTTVDAVITTLTATVLSASATVFTSEPSVAGYTLSRGPINNVSIRGNWFNGQDLTAGLSTQHAIFANVVGSNWTIENNLFRNTTHRPIRLGGGFALINSSISNNTFVDCNAVASGSVPENWISLLTGVPDSRVVIRNNVALDSIGSRLAALVATNNVLGSTYIIGPNYCPDASAGIVGTGATVVQQGLTQGLLTAAGSLVPVNDVIPFNSAGSFTLTSVPTITDGYKGQVITIVNVDIGDTITFQDQGRLPGSNLLLESDTVALPPRGFLQLRFDGTDWVQLGPTPGAITKTPAGLKAIVCDAGDVVTDNDEVVWSD